MKLNNFIFFSVAFFLIFSLSKNIIDFKKKAEFYKQYSKTLNKLEDENKALKIAIKKSKDPFVLEKSIREKLNHSKNKENVIILPKNFISISPTPTPTLKPLQQWLDLLL